MDHDIKMKNKSSYVKYLYMSIIDYILDNINIT